jgi:alcohol dehydrogenase class IV
MPCAVVLDPAITLHTPEWLWLSTGIRAVDHAIERTGAAVAERSADLVDLIRVSIKRVATVMIETGIHGHVLHIDLCRYGARRHCTTPCTDARRDAEEG